MIDEDLGATFAAQSANVLPLIISMSPFGGPGSVLLPLSGGVSQLQGVLKFLYGILLKELYFCSC